VSGAGEPFPDSLCHGCRHHRIVSTARSRFLMCRAPELPKYAPQPVRRCPAFDAGPPAGPP
jgi:hypothetical protein